MASDPISALLASSPELRPLAERLLLIKRLQRRYRTIAPEQLARASRVCAIDGTTVVICATSGPVAAALRHLAPRLLQGLRLNLRNPKHPRDQDFTSIRVEIQVEVPVRKRPVVARGELPHDKLSAVARGLSDSPLKQTLERLAAQPSKTRPKT